MSVGYVYVLTNDFMPGLVKIGKTTRDVEARANELFNTGVPSPFKVATFFYFPDCDKAEEDAHKAMGDVRVSPSREFFKASVNEASDVISEILLRQVSGAVSAFLPDYELVIRGGGNG